MPESTFLGAFNPRKSLCSGCVFSLKCRKNANTKNFEGGRGGQKKIFVLDFFGCFFRSLVKVSLLVFLAPAAPIESLEKGEEVTTSLLKEVVTKARLWGSFALEVNELREA